MSGKQQVQYAFVYLRYFMLKTNFREKVVLRVGVLCFIFFLLQLKENANDVFVSNTRLVIS